jgi:hypothetical protein
VLSFEVAGTRTDVSVGRNSGVDDDRFWAIKAPSQRDEPTKSGQVSASFEVERALR